MENEIKHETLGVFTKRLLRDFFTITARDLAKRTDLAKQQGRIIESEVKNLRTSIRNEQIITWAKTLPFVTARFGPTGLGLLVGIFANDLPPLVRPLLPTVAGPLVGWVALAITLRWAERINRNNFRGPRQKLAEYEGRNVL